MFDRFVRQAEEEWQTSVLGRLVRAAGVSSSTSHRLRSGDCGQWSIRVKPSCLSRWESSSLLCCPTGRIRGNKGALKGKYGKRRHLQSDCELHPHRWWWCCCFLHSLVPSPASAGPFELPSVQPPVLKSQQFILITSTF